MPAWNEILSRIQTIQNDAGRALDLIRSQYLRELNSHTGRNIICYYSGFLSKQVNQTEITGEDINGFMMAVHKLDRSKGLDLLIHTPGGSVSAALSIVHYLRKMFDENIRAIIPQIAMSAGTMIACSCKKIILAKHSQLGPTDPHLMGIPAAGVLKEFEQAFKEVKKDPSKIPIWQVIIGQYRPTFLSRCDNAIKLSNAFVEEQLRTVMFKSEEDAGAKAKRIVEKLTDYSGNKGHERPIHIDECKAMGLYVEPLEADSLLQDLVLTIHHCYMHAFMNTNAYKVIENHAGATLVKNVVTSRN